MQLWMRTLALLPLERSGRVTVEQGLIAALIGVVVVSIVTTLSGVMEAPPPESVPVAGSLAP